MLEQGRQHHQLGDLNLARTSYQSILDEAPDHFDAMHLLGVACAQCFDYALAIDLFSKAVTLNERNPIVHNNLGNAQAALKDWASAVQSYDKAIKFDSRYALAYFNRGIAQEELGYLDRALLSYQHAIKFNPQYIHAYLNCGVVLQKLGRIHEALEQYGVAIALDPHFVDAYYNRGTDLMELSLLDAAVRDFDQAIVMRPDFADAHWNKSLALLCLGDWAAAWDIYDWRWRRSDLGPNEFVPPLDPLRFQYASNLPASKSVFVWAEQGVGDEVFNASMLSSLANRFAAVTVQTDGRLIPLLQRSFTGITFVNRADQVDQASFDLHLAHGDLGYFFRRDATGFKEVKSRYLCADDSRAKEFRMELKTDSRPLVGVTWRSKNNRLGSRKSIDLDSLLPIFMNPALRFVSLQYGDTLDELNSLKQMYGVEINRCQSVDNFSDLDGHAALIEACDMVLTVSNTTAHIAGALGKATFVMLSKGEGRLWYWANRQDRRSIWYPAVEVFEQTEHGKWDDVVSSIFSSISEKYIAR